MGKMASPAALARTLSLQRANARAKSCRTESSSDHKDGSQLSKRIGVLFTSISCDNNATEHRCIDTQMKASLPSKQAVLVDHGSSHNAIKRSLSADVPSNYKACFSSLSQRIERGSDLWDREFSSMSSYASDQDGIICGLQRRLNSGSFLCDSKVREDACSKSSWSEESLADALIMEMEEDASCNGVMRGGIGSDCRETGSYGYGVSNQSLQGAVADDKGQADEGAKSGDKGGDSGRGGLKAQWLYIGNDAEEGGKVGDDIECRRSRSGKMSNGDVVQGEAGRSREERIREGGDDEEKGPALLPPNSVAVEKVSVNPVEDFRESMYEMMMEKDMEEECADMEDLLHYYLLLNPCQLHDLIREVFSHVWIDIIMTTR